MRIPEYYYNSVQSEDVYYDYIKSIIDKNAKCNAIDEEIVRVSPHHIITTNYDCLLEKADAVKDNEYAVVSKDEDLLSKANDKYIIKMHGTIEDVKTIVLKERDYLDYEQEHLLISTYIKSLLVNHTFLFMGYSLNDNNLNLIINWINYFSKEYGIDNRPPKILLTDTEYSQFEIDRLEANEIYLVNLLEIPNDIVVKADDSITADVGRRIYAYLRCIQDKRILGQSATTDEYLINGLALLNSYQWVSWEDFAKTIVRSGVSMSGTTMTIYDTQAFNSIKTLVDSNNSVFYDVIKKTGLSRITNPEGSESLEFERAIPIDDGLRLELDNDYLSIKKTIDRLEYDSKVYYYALLAYSEESIRNIIRNERETVKRKNIVQRLLQDNRERLALKYAMLQDDTMITNDIKRQLNNRTNEQKFATTVINKLFTSMADDIDEMSRILDSQKVRYSYNTNTIRSGDADSEIRRLQSYVYDFYFYLKKNKLPLDYYRDTYRYFKNYIEAIMCSYSLEKVEKNSEWYFTTDRRKYTLNEIDFDIITKYIKPRDLKSLIKDYSITEIKIEKIDVVKKLKNLCKSYEKYSIYQWKDYIENLTILISHIKLSNKDVYQSYSTLVRLFLKLTEKSNTWASDVVDYIAEIARNITISNYMFYNQRLFLRCIDNDVIKSVLDRKYNRLKYLVEKAEIGKDSEFSEIVNQRLQAMEDSMQKIRAMVCFISLLPEHGARDYLLNNLHKLNGEDIFYLIYDHEIVFDNKVQKAFVNMISSLHKKRIEAPGVRSWPDWLRIDIDYCLLLHLLGYDFNLKQLEPFSMHSDCLQFILNPKNFDYSKVETDNIMWRNLFFNNQYQHYFIDNKEHILTNDLKNVFSERKETQNQDRIVYGILLNKDELNDW